ncbi:diguanylate cyclase domain-containing protein [Agarivorans sp. QJM3NY_25]|uniref:diguanylate cyclase domain-containing protein n=1 Tax=Agarivorans sp. QJM3NY_25 TaxID=3421430 RepID=UPI003D7C751A
MTYLFLCLMSLLLVVSFGAYRKLKQQQLRQESILASLAEGLILTSEQGQILYMNQPSIHLLNIKTKVIGQAISTILPNIEHLAANQTRQSYGLLATNEHLEFELTLIIQADGNRLYILHSDQLGRAQPEEVERFKRSQYFARIGTWDWDVNTEQLYWSDAIYAMFGYKVGEIQPSYQLFCNSVHPEDRERVKAGEQRCIETGENHDEEYRVVWPDSSIHWVRETGNVVNDKNGKVAKMMGVVRDITEEKNAENELMKLAHIDTLTGLPNRLELEEKLAKAINQAKAEQSRVALIFIDLNKFKDINDNYGHHRGDQVLTATANRLRHTLRKTDFIARIGGDEFVMILQGLELCTEPPQEGELMAIKVLNKLSKPIEVAATSHEIGASLGIALFPDHANNMDELLHIADQAMYQAKRRGKNKFQFGSKHESLPLQGEN